MDSLQIQFPVGCILLRFGLGQTWRISQEFCNSFMVTYICLSKKFIYLAYLRDITSGWYLLISKFWYMLEENVALKCLQLVTNRSYNVMFLVLSMTKYKLWQMINVNRWSKIQFPVEFLFGSDLVYNGRSGLKDNK